MKDILKQYKKNKIIGNIGVVAASLVVAIGVNTFLIDGTNMGQNLKASVLNSQGIEIQSDIFLDIKGDKLVLKTSNPISEATSLGVSFSYNPENLEILTIESSQAEIKNISNESGISTIIVNFSQTTSFGENSEILEITTVKKELKSENMNMINANFTDSSGENYLLSTSGITF